MIKGADDWLTQVKKNGAIFPQPITSQNKFCNMLPFRSKITEIYN